MNKFSICAIASAMTVLGGCADLGFGVDVGNESPYSPYYYGTIYNNNPYFYNGPYWNPIYPGPPAPPVLNPGVGPVIPNRPSININPGVNRVPTQVGGVQRPGNGGLANPAGARSPRTPR